MKLSLLICTMYQRAEMYHRLTDELKKQISRYVSLDGIEICTSDSSTMKVGEKRNELLDMAKGEYVAFIDDDDMVSSHYIELVMNAIQNDVDCCSLRGVITFDGANPAIFEHSLMYNQWRTIEGAEYEKGEVKYERFPNHLNAIRASIAKQFRFPEVDFGEDHKWAEAIHKSRLIKSEAYIPSVIYHYLYQPNKPKLK